MATRTFRFAFLDKSDNVPRPIRFVTRCFTPERSADFIARAMVHTATEETMRGDAKDIVPQDSQCRWVN